MPFSPSSLHSVSLVQDGDVVLVVLGLVGHGGEVLEDHDAQKVLQVPDNGTVAVSWTLPSFVVSRMVAQVVQHPRESLGPECRRPPVRERDLGRRRPPTRQTEAILQLVHVGVARVLSRLDDDIQRSSLGGIRGGSSQARSRFTATMAEARQQDQVR